ncbi:MAG: tetratricopeptide repeat protein [Chloroflexaceae bacterium]|nr:tetratricopeptide repeat protein [Chloroflexaceae bacterium]
MDLSRAALCYAQAEYPKLNTDAYLNRLADMAEELRDRLPPTPYPLKIIQGINRYLFEELGFHGNAEDYYDPRNSYLNEVLERRTGIPITLAVVYLELARRLSFGMVGVALPGHFLVRPNFAGAEIFVDPFHSGEILFEQDCQLRLSQIFGQGVHLEPQWLVPASKRQILARLLTNLKYIYLNRQQFAKTLSLVELILQIFPDQPQERRDRGLLLYHLERWAQAAQDLEFYLTRSPDARDRGAIFEILRKIQS